LAALILASGFLSLHAICMTANTFNITLLIQWDLGKDSLSYSGLPASYSQVKNVWWSCADKFMS
jgi:hypothetical protein